MTDVEAYKMALTDDDSDDEEDVAMTLGIGTSPGGRGPSMDIPKVLNMEDFEELKKKTLSLVDPEWKQSRNQELVAKMLALDSPSITPQVRHLISQLKSRLVSLYDNFSNVSCVSFYIICCLIDG